MSLLKNSSIVIVGVIVSNVLAYIFHFIAGRVLGPEDYGVFGALMALFLLVAMPANALSSAITKFTSRFYSEKQLSLIALFRKQMQNDVLVVSAILLAIISLFSSNIAQFLNIESNVPVIIVGITLVAALLLPVNRGLLQGMRKYQVYSWNSIIEAFSRLILLVVLIYAGLGVNGAILAYGLAYLVAFLCVFPYIKEAKIEESNIQKIDSKPVYRFILLVVFVNFVLQSIINLPSIFVKHYYTSEFTGYWTAALNIARISLFISGAITLVMFPEIAGETKKKLKKEIFYNAAKLVLLTSSAMAIVFFVIPDFLIKILYGEDFLGAAPILEWMGVAMIFLGLIQIWSSFLLASKK